MSYLLDVTWYNGYRCCCMQTWEEQIQVETWEEVLPYLQPGKMDKDSRNLHAVKVTDDTGEPWGSLYLSWPVFRGRGSGYQLSHWSGWYAEGEAITHVNETYSGSTFSQRIDRPYGEVEAEYREAWEKRFP